jgi:hypothetical protein
MVPPDDARLRPLKVIAVVVALVLLVRWILAATEPPNRELIDLISLLVRVQLTSSLLANALTFAAVILAAAIIPLTVVWALQRAERPPKTAIPETTHDRIQPQAAPKTLDGDGRRADLPAGESARIPESTSQPDRAGNKKRR